ncbi:phosphatase 2C-like domain-containing protein [Zopfochytrium polystomum]|nr:phosphatase 2C-like domain-containing protein [Zopfochytrium polystomum]
MGQTLSEPITEKGTTTGGDERVFYGSSSMQGWRIQMEDAHTTILDLLKEEADISSKLFNANDSRVVSFFGVYDGHGGSSVAKFSGRELHRKIMADPEFKARNYRAAIKNGFLATDQDLRTNPEYIRDPSGCTAVTVLITDDGKIFCGNAGDSRAILSKKGRAVPLSFDHKPVNAGESARIRQAGGFVEFGRVNGNLALSRAVGDFEFKQNSALAPEDQIVTVNPDIEEMTLNDDEDEFIVLACDGIWDCMSNEEVAFYVRSEIAKNRKTLPQIAESIMDRCLAPDSDLGAYGCDNMTVIIVGILSKKKTQDEWYEMIRDRFLADEVAGIMPPPPLNAQKGPATSREDDDGGDGSDSSEDTAVAVDTK